MKQIIVGFSRPKNKVFPIFSWLIRLIDDAPYSHVYIRWETSVDIDIVYQASKTSVNFMGGDLFDESATPIVTYKLNIPDACFTKLLRFSISNSGKPYGFAQVFGVALACLFKLQTNPFSKGYVCSELVGIILQDLGFNLPKKDINLLTPKDIQRTIQANLNS